MNMNLPPTLKMIYVPKTYQIIENQNSQIINHAPLLQSLSFQKTQRENMKVNLFVDSLKTDCQIKQSLIFSTWYNVHFNLQLENVFLDNKMLHFIMCLSSP